MKLSDELQYLYNFLRQPSNYFINQNKNHPQILYLLFRIYVMELLLTIIFMSILLYLTDNRADFIDDFMAKTEGIRAIIVLAIIVPLVEELIFRLPLVFRPDFMGLSAGTFSFMLVHLILDGIGLLEADQVNYVAICMACIIGILIYFTSKKKETSIRSFYKSRYNLIVWFSILFFGFMHIFNFDLSIKNLLLLPFLTLPQLVAGTVLSFIRLRFGFVFAIGYHISHNLLVVLL